MYIMALHIPARVAFSNFSGVTQGMRIIFTTMLP